MHKNKATELLYLSDSADLPQVKFAYASRKADLRARFDSSKDEAERRDCLLQLQQIRAARDYLVGYHQAVNSDSEEAHKKAEELEALLEEVERTRLDSKAKDSEKTEELEQRLAAVETEKTDLQKRSLEMTNLEEQLAQLNRERLDAEREDTEKTSDLRQQLARVELEKDELRKQSQETAELEEQLAKLERDRSHAEEQDAEKSAEREREHRESRAQHVEKTTELEERLAAAEREKHDLQNQSKATANLEEQLARLEREHHESEMRDAEKTAKLEERLAAAEREKDDLQRQTQATAKLEEHLALLERERQESVNRESDKNVHLEERLAALEREKNDLRKQSEAASKPERTEAHLDRIIEEDDRFSLEMNEAIPLEPDPVIPETQPRKRSFGKRVAVIGTVIAVGPLIAAATVVAVKMYPSSNRPVAAPVPSTPPVEVAEGIRAEETPDSNGTNVGGKVVPPPNDVGVGVEESPDTSAIDDFIATTELMSYVDLYETAIELRDEARILLAYSDHKDRTKLLEKDEFNAHETLNENIERLDSGRLFEEEIGNSEDARDAYDEAAFGFFGLLHFYLMATVLDEEEDDFLQYERAHLGIDARYVNRRRALDLRDHVLKEQRRMHKYGQLDLLDAMRADFTEADRALDAALYVPNPDDKVHLYDGAIAALSESIKSVDRKYWSIVTREYFDAFLVEADCWAPEEFQKAMEAEESGTPPKKVAKLYTDARDRALREREKLEGRQEQIIERLAASSDSENKEEASALIHEADILMEQKKYLEASENFKDALRLIPRRRS